MPDIWGQTLDPIGVNQVQTTNLSRLAEVIFIKKVRNIPIAGLPGEADSVEAKKKFAEFIGNGLMVENKDLEKRDGVIGSKTLKIDRNTTNFFRNIYYQITTGASVNTPVDPGTGLSLLPNQDVSMMTIDSTVLGSSTAQLTVRNPLNKYVHQQHPLYLGQAIFESDDVVYINLPGLDGNIYRAFTGFVTTVTIDAQVGDTINNTIVIECEDMLKRLRENRVNIKPGYTPAEARRTTAPYSISFGADLPHQILAKVFAAAYCDFESIPTVYDQLAQFRSLAITDPDQAAQSEFQLIDQYTKVPIGQGHIADNSGFIGPLQDVPAPSPFFVTTGNLIIPAGQLAGNLEPTAPLAVTEDTSRTIPRQIFGFRQAADPTNLDDNSKAVGGAAPVSQTSSYPLDDLAFVLEGTAQPAYSLAFNPFGIQQWVSEWKSAYEVAREIADTVAFELFTTPEGVLWFRPQNILLPADVSGNTPTSSVSVGQQPRVGSEYWLDRKYIKHEAYTNTDRDVFTVAVTLGHYTIQALDGSGLEWTRAGIAVDSLKYQQLGARMAPQQNKLELIDKSACIAYSRAFLNRVNSKARRGSVDYMGDARLRVGNPCYIPHRNQIYYIESISHQFVAGKSYTMTLSLNNGRVPISIATQADANNLAATIGDPSLAADLKSRYLFSETIKRLGPDSGLGILDPKDPLNPPDVLSGVASVQVDEVTRYKQHGPPDQDAVILPIESQSSVSQSSSTELSTTTVFTGGDGQLVFNGYVWEDIQAMTYEDMIPDLKTSTPTIYLSKLLLDQRLNSRTFRSLLQNYQQRTPTASPLDLQNNLLRDMASAVVKSLSPDGQIQSQIASTLPRIA